MQEYYRGKTEERGKNVLEDEEKKSWAGKFSGTVKRSSDLYSVCGGGDFPAAAGIRRYGNYSGCGAVKCDGGSDTGGKSEKIAGGVKTDDQPACTASGRG